MYWTTGLSNSIYSANLDGSDVRALVSVGASNPIGIVLDASRAQLFWADRGTRRILRIDLNSGQITVAVSPGGLPCALAIDPAAEVIYWSDQERREIRAARTNGSNPQVVVSNTGVVEGLALDPSASRIFWTDSESRSLFRANLDGSAVKRLVTIQDFSFPAGIAIDALARRMYWTDYGTDQIRSADLDGHDNRTVFRFGLAGTQGLAIDRGAGKLYWVDTGWRRIQRANLDGTLVEDLVTSFPGYLSGILLDPDCNANNVADHLDIANGSSLDCNGNIIPDECEPGVDCNGNAVADICDIVSSYSLDCNRDAVPDECETDCNHNSIVDECDLRDGLSEDCNRNEVPDECEEQADCNVNGVQDICDIAAGSSPDCNRNRRPDECDLASGLSQDCNFTGVPDECEVDCNHNGLADECDVGAGTSLDCNTNGTPDECESDCNTNNIPDSCDIAQGTSLDEDGDGIPNECENWAHCVSDAEHFDYAPHRTDRVVEYLAMELSGQLRAPDTEYNRIARDLNLLTTAYPILETVQSSRLSGDQILVQLDVSLPHDGFDALNAFYQVVDIYSFHVLPGLKLLTFCDTINTGVLYPEYEALPEVLYAEASCVAGGGYGDYVDLSVDGDVYVYEFFNGAGDCPSGCIYGQIWRFAIDVLGTITIISYDPGPCGVGLPNDGDFDADGVMDCLDPCPADEDPGPVDTDGDGIGDNCDACALTIPGASVDNAGCPPSIAGDIDRDGDVAKDDYARLRNCLRGPGLTACGYPEVRVYLDTDWDVDLRDFAIFQNCFSGTNVPADAACNH